MPTAKAKAKDGSDSNFVTRVAVIFGLVCDALSGLSVGAYFTEVTASAPSTSPQRFVFCPLRQNLSEEKDTVHFRTALGPRRKEDTC
jgi:hypothetical protein